MPRIAATIEPFAFTLRSVLARFVIASEVEVALPSVEFPVVVIFVAKRLPVVSAVELAYGNCEAATVELEKNTPAVAMDDDVAAVVVPKKLAYAKIEPPAEAAPQLNWPLFQVRKLFPAQTVSPAPKSAVVDAYEALKFVVDALANVCKPVKTFEAYVFAIVDDAFAKNEAEVVEK